jgi:hypothetical protein
MFTDHTGHNFDEQILKESLETAVDMINERIGPFDQKIVKHTYGLNQIEYFVFTSTAKTSLAKLQNSFSEFELEYFKQVFTQVVEDEDLNITPRDALNLCINVGGKVSKVRAEKLIEEWSASGYFHRENDLIHLGPKSITEFAETIRNLKLNHIKNCGLCNEIAAWVRDYRDKKHS